ncbi:Alkaline phosphodiesterase I / Nucleotide pyrophosphatase [hydrothermal vent metagenome]|uniref:Alkaline phosphodiesterase I / Nucleotide pyrophosphatase n=1 Tax=hydrothermal vent metagenome TaxID=652676 RepID=A0A3B0S212_9ZZZZ
MNRLSSIMILLMFLLTGCAAVAPAEIPVKAHIENRETVTILISIDGFRPDYLERGITPVLSALATDGIHGPMRPSFPTKTFPNHWTLVTGKHPDNHGVVGNTMEDIARPGEKFTMSNKDPFWWDKVEPIWITGEKQGIRTATMFWPGSSVELNGKRPSDWWPFDQALSNDRRVNAVIDWMRRPSETRPRLVTLYFDTVDTAGHYFGPAPGEKLNTAIAAVDAQIGSLKKQLDILRQPVNFVIVSDHGMTEISPERIIYLDQILPREQYRLIEQGNYVGMEPQDGNLVAIKTAFIRPHDHMECWERNDIPAHFQYGKNPRVPSVFCLPAMGWVAYQDVPEWLTGIAGGHGYDHRHVDMQAFFVAQGPNIAANGAIDIFDNVDIYSLVANLAGIKPNTSDGSLLPFADNLIPD